MEGGRPEETALFCFCFVLGAFLAAALTVVLVTMAVTVVWGIVDTAAATACKCQLPVWFGFQMAVFILKGHLIAH